jgi:asparagine synthase (glutamine-hydrolysing)
MTWQDSQCQLGRYYAIEDQIDEALELNHAEVVDRFENLLRDSIKLQSLCDRKVGVHLSGGVDSSIVAALARDEISAPLDSYTFAYDEEKYSELPFASDVARHLKIGNQASFLRSADVETWLPRALIAEDEPFTSFRQLSHHKLYADFAQSGSTVVLEASGGDEIGAGYSSYLWSNFLDQAQTGSVTGAAANFSSSLASMGLSEGQRETFLFGSALNYQMPGMCTSDGMPYLDPEVLSGDFFETSTRFRPEYQRPFKSALRNQQYMDLVYAKLPRGLRYIERASSAVGREARLPLLDHRIVELGFQASNQSKIIPGTLRRFMKDASSQLLPESVIAKNKRSVADPQRDWLRGDLKSMVHETLASRPFRERGIFNAPRAIQSFDRFCKGDPSLNSLGIFQMFIVEHWFRNFWR